jgi:hypothetical protein
MTVESEDLIYSVTTSEIVELVSESGVWRWARGND